MKKIAIIIFFFISIFNALFFVGCSCQKRNTDIQISAHFEHPILKASVGDVINLEKNTFIIVPQKLHTQVMFWSSNILIAEVNALTGEIICKAPGVAKITGSVKNTNLEDSFVLKITNRPIYPSGFSLQTEDKIVVDLNDFNTKNTLELFGEGVNIKPSITYSVPDVVSYNYLNGIITPIKKGEATVFVNVMLDTGVVAQKSFIVQVIDKVAYIEVEEKYNASKNSHLQVSYCIVDNTQPNNYALNQDVIVKILNEDSACRLVLKDYMSLVFFTGDVPGRVFISITCTFDSSINKIIEINIT